MTYYSMRQYKLIGYEKAKAKNKMYNALIQNKQGKVIKLPFGDNRYENYRDITGLNLYPHLIHNDPNRRRLFRSRHKGFLRKGYFSPSYFSYNILW